MSRDNPNDPAINGEGLRIGLVASRYNGALVDALVERTMQALRDNGVYDDDMELHRVPGAAEIPYAANMLMTTLEFDCVIALGVVVAGDTSHHEIIGMTASQALQNLSIDSDIPVINGIIVVNSQAQAEARVTGEHDRGKEFAHAALAMADLKVRLNDRLDEIYAAEEEGMDEDWSPDEFSGRDDDDDDDDPSEAWRRS